MKNSNKNEIISELTKASLCLGDLLCGIFGIGATIYQNFSFYVKPTVAGIKNSELYTTNIVKDFFELQNNKPTVTNSLQLFWTPGLPLFIGVSSSI